MLAPLISLATLSPVTTGAGALAATVLAMKGRSVAPSSPPPLTLVTDPRARAWTPGAPSARRRGRPGRGSRGGVRLKWPVVVAGRPRRHDGHGPRHHHPRPGGRAPARGPRRIGASTDPLFRGRPRRRRRAGVRHPRRRLHRRPGRCCDVAADAALGRDDRSGDRVVARSACRVLLADGRHRRFRDGSGLRGVPRCDDRSPPDVPAWTASAAMTASWMPAVTNDCTSSAAVKPCAIQQLTYSSRTSCVGYFRSRAGAPPRR